MSKSERFETAYQILSLFIAVFFITALLFSGYQFYNNVVSPIQERENRLEQNDQIIPNEFIDETEKTEKNSFDSFSSDPSTSTARNYLTNVRSRDYQIAYSILSPAMKKEYSIESFEEAIKQKHTGKIVRYRLDSIQILNENNRKLTITAFTLDQSNKNSSYIFTFTLTKTQNTKLPWQITAFTDSLG